MKLDRIFKQRPKKQSSLSMKIKTVLSNVARTGLLAVLLFTLQGCHYFRSAAPSDCEEPVVPPCEQECTPCPEAECVEAPQVETECDVCCPSPHRIRTELYELEKCGPGGVALGQTFNYTLNVTPRMNLMDVHVTDMLPDSVEYLSSNPPAKVDGNTLMWYFSELRYGEHAVLEITAKAKDTGNLCNCAMVTAIPFVCSSCPCGEPRLEIMKTGPEHARVGDDVYFDVVVVNKGTYPAECVVLVDMIPDGLEHISRHRTLKMELGNLSPQASKSYHLCFRAAKTGKHCNIAKVTSSNTPSQEATACVTVTRPSIEISKKGPPEQSVNKSARYQIVVTNTGDVDLDDVSVTDTVPSQATVVSAPQRSKMSGKTLTWVIPTLAAGQSQEFTVELSVCNPGEYCNRTQVSVPRENLSDSAEACTCWKGIPALTLEIYDTEDPLCVGENVCYNIRVLNQGTGTDKDVKIVVNFPKEITPVTARGPTTYDISTSTVTFSPVKELPPGQIVQYQVTGKSISVGDARVEAQVTSELIDQPLTSGESTQVY